MRNTESYMVAPNAAKFARVCSFALSLAATFSMLALTACVTKQAAPSTVPAVSFQLLPPATIQAGAQVQLVATVINDPKMLGIDWNASCVNTNCGSFSPAHTASGQATTYTAPSSVPQGGVNIAARATALPAQTVVANVGIFTNVQIKLTGFPSSPLGAGNTTTLTAVVTGDPNNPPLGVGWSLNCTAALCGTLSAQNTASGVPVTYTAPPSVTTPFTVTFQATPLADTTQIISASITVNPVSGVTIAITAPSAIQAGGTANVTATVSNDPKGGGVIWSATCTNSAAAGMCGTFTQPPTTASGVPITYTAPTTVPTGGLPVTITATSVDSPAVATAITTITNPTLSVTISTPPPSSMPVGTTAQVIATLQNDTMNLGVTWTATCTAAAGSNCGSFTPASTKTAIPTTYQAPSIIPNGGGVVTITATTVGTPVTMAIATVTITAANSVSINWTSAGTTPPTTLLLSAEATVSATVANDLVTTPNGVTWSVACTAGTGGDCGSFTTNPTANGLSTTYQAPSVLPQNGGIVTITATAQAAPNPSISKSITITAPTLTVTINNAPTSIEAGTNTELSATITNDSPTPPNGVNWSVTCTGGTGTNPCGSFNPTNTLTGVSTTYTAPATAPTGGTVTITATSAAQGNVSASTTAIPITANTSAGLLNGHYALNLTTGTNGGGLVGSILADGQGHIINGEEDAGITTAFCQGGYSVTEVTGTYVVNSNNTGTITLNTGGSSCFGSSGVQTISFAATGTGSPATHLLIMEFDNTVGSGSLDLQTIPSTPSGSYAFVFPGQDVVNATGNPPNTMDVGGTMTVSGSSLSIAEDINDQAIPSVSQATGTGTLSTIDSFGRGTITITSASPLLSGNMYVFYVVNSSEIKFVEDDGNYFAVGIAFSQGTSGFSGDYVYTFLGTDFAQVFTMVGGGTLQTTGATTLTGIMDFNDNGLQTGSGGDTINGTFTAPSAGRGTLTLTGAPTGVSKFAYYPTANNGILLLELDNDFASTGLALPQTGTTFSNGNYAMNFTNGTPGTPNQEEDAVGQVMSDGTGTFTGVVDFYSTTADMFPQAALTGAFSATGLGRYTGNFVIATSATTSQTLKEFFYVASPSKVLFIEADPTNASAQTSGIMELQ